MLLAKINAAPMDIDNSPKVPLQLVVYTDDTVDIAFVDGSKLSLTPCGTSFTYSQATEHAIYGEQTIQQRTQFVTSTFQQPLREAIDFRNRFAERPFLCREIVDTSRIVHMHADVYDVAWPQSGEKARIEALPSGGFKLQSLDGYASVSLAPCEQHVTVEYLGKLPTSDTAFRAATTQATNRMTDNKIFSAPPNEGGDSWRWEYAWVTQFHSIVDVPASWQHAVNLLLDHCRATRHGNTTHDADKMSDKTLTVTDTLSASITLPTFSDTTEASDVSVKRPQSAALVTPTASYKNGDNSKIADSSKSVSRSASQQSQQSMTTSSIVGLDQSPSNCTYSVLPATLPLRCPNPHKHKRLSKPGANAPVVSGVAAELKDLTELVCATSRVKVVCLQGVVYRLLRNRSPTVEIYPGDGSMLRSTGAVGCYFTHYIWNRQTQSLEERMYSLKCPPTYVPSLQYSVERLIQRGARFLQLMLDENLNTFPADDACWRTTATLFSGITQPAATLPTHVIEEADVSDIGRFQVSTNGRVHIVFADRTLLDMHADISPRLQHLGLPVSQDKATEVPAGFARLLLPNGRYHYVALSQAGGYQKYITWAQNWVSWVNSTCEEREKFYRSTTFQPDVSLLSRAATAELLKIKAFDYIVSTSSSLSHKPTSQLPSPTNRSSDNNINGLPLSAALHAADLPFVMATRNAAAAPADIKSGDINMRAVEEALRQSAATIRDIDRLLAVNSEPYPVRDRKS